MELYELDWKCVDWNRLARCRDKWWALVTTVMSLLFSLIVGYFLTSLGIVNFPSRTLLHEDRLLHVSPVSQMDKYVDGCMVCR
jgi:hypothetical protein